MRASEGKYEAIYTIYALVESYELEEMVSCSFVRRVEAQNPDT